MINYKSPNKSIFIKPGQRALVLGATGSGKSVMMQEMARQALNAPVFVMDTKGDDGFLTLKQHDETDIVIESYKEFLKLMKTTKRSKLPEYIIIRPNAVEMTEPEILDSYLQYIYDNVANCYIVVDEAGQIHSSGGRALPGLINLLTRGRSRNITTIIGSQRPAFLSYFCYSEVTKIIVYRINNRKDRSKIADFSTYPIDSIPLPYHFYYFEVNKDSGVWYKPIPYKQVTTQTEGVIYKPINWI